MRVGGVAILSGAAVGVLIALAFHGASPPEPNGGAQHGSAAVSASSAPPAAPVTSESASTAEPVATTPVASESASAADPAPAPAAPQSPTLVVPASSASAAVSPATSAEPFPIATPLPPVTTPKELERAEVRCYEVDPEECGRAADAYDAGRLVPRDAARAANLRKVELTRLNRRCEQRSPHACLVLAGHYESGDGVDENDKHARALVAHARELCRHGAKTECVDGEPK